jgi:hypothetical protein
VAAAAAVPSTIMSGDLGSSPASWSASLRVCSCRASNLGVAELFYKQPAPPRSHPVSYPFSKHIPPNNPSTPVADITIFRVPYTSSTSHNPTVTYLVPPHLNFSRCPGLQSTSVPSS